MDFLLNSVVVLGLFVLPGALAAAAVALLSRRTRSAVAGGLVLLAAAALLPLTFVYAIAVGVAGGLLGGSMAAVWVGRRLSWPHRSLTAFAVLALVAVPVLVTVAFQIKEDESYDRCAAEKAVVVVEQNRAAGRGYPDNMREIAMQDGEYGDPCYVSNGVNWLYRVGTPGTYTLGYWVDWHVARRVCLHTAGTQGWSCAFERWGLFRPGEVDTA